MKKKVLVVGDSITEGTLGVNYLNLLEKECKDYQFYNLGIGGDTLYGIKNRLLKALENDRYDIIVIEAGHNDIIIPELTRMGVIYGLISRYLVKRGSIPHPKPTDFERILKETINGVKKLCDSKIILTTLSCLNEDLNAKTNRLRDEINRIIKNTGLENQCLVADVGHEFNKELSKSTNKSFFLGNAFNVFFFDARKTRTIEGAQKLSLQRGLKLTIDGVHLSLDGAKIYVECIKNLLNS